MDEVQLRLKIFIFVSVLFFGLFSWANYVSWHLPQPMGKESVLGKEVWQKYNCVSCHTLFGNGGYVGEDLTHITTKRDSAYLVDFFLNPPAYPPNKKHKHPGLKRTEAVYLISYLEYLDKIPTLGWPPKSRDMEGREGL